MLIPICEITINPGRREVLPGDVKELADSISQVGLISPILVDQAYTLIAGLHRLEAVKLLGRTEIECNVSSLSGLQAELAEIDENVIRRGLHYMDEGRQLSRRKEIYEALHPEVRQGKRNGQTSKTAPGAVLAFAEDTAEKLGIAPRTIREKIQVARKITPEVEQIVKSNHWGMKTALKLSRLEPAQQEEAASRLAAGEIKSLDQYQAPSIEPEKGEESLPEGPQISRSVPYSLGSKHFASLEESIADLKDPNKDCRYTLDALLADIDGFVDRFHRDFEWYTMAVCTDLYPQLSQIQVEFVRDRFETISAAMKNLLQLMKESKNE